MYEEISAIERYVNEHLFEPKINWPKKEFNERVYSRWAAFEIMQAIMDYPFIEAHTVVECFMLKMILYAQLEESRDGIFSIARDTAEEILLLFS